MIRNQEERSAKQRDLSLNFEKRRPKKENNVVFKYGNICQKRRPQFFGCAF